MDLQQDFLNDYLEAIAKFNSSNFVLYLRNMRPTLERFCKLVIYDVLANESLYNDLLNGEKHINCDWKSCTCEVQDISCDPKEGSSLAMLAKCAIFYKKPHLLSNDKVMKRMKRGIDSTFNEIFSRYGEMSGEGSHSASDEDATIKAEALEKSFWMWIRNLKKVLSSNLYDFFESLPKAEVGNSEIETEQVLNENNDFVILDEMTNRFEQLPGVNYIALLPENLTDKFGKSLSANQLQEFYRIQWNLVVDLNKKTTDGLYEQAPSFKKSSMRIITDNISEVSGLSNLVVC